MTKRAMVIAPHCDDEVYGMGGTMMKLVDEGWEVTTVVACCGGDFKFEHLGASVSRADRLNELSRVSESLGVSFIALPFEFDSMMDTVPMRDVVMEIERVHDLIQADRWYVAGPSTHQDHRVVFEASMTAGRTGRPGSPAEIYLYELPAYSMNHSPWRFLPMVWEDVSGYVERKIDAALLYESQVRESGPLSPARLREWAVKCGSECGVGCAERFEIVRVVR